MLTYGPGEEKMVKELKEMIGSKALISPETSLMQLTALLSRCKLFIGGDTGPTHLASVLDVPVVSFFGASDAKRNRPYGKNSYIIQLNELDCVPCWKTKCEDLKCVKNITPEMLMKGVDELMNK
jgi:ADP-heptose:LPS heptosyltransferase